MGKKNPFWFLLSGIGVIQVILYFVFIWPQGSELLERVEELQKKTNRLDKDYLKPEKIPTTETIARHSEHKRILEEEYNKAIQFYRNKDDMSLEKWFVGSPGSPPSLDWFKVKYADEFNVLRHKCEEAGIRIITAADAGDEERKTVTEWPKLQAQETSETVPKGGGFGFWEGEPITTMNQKTAQKQYWIQETIVEALRSAGAKALVAVSFAKSPKPKAAGKPKEEKAPQTEFERLFDVIEVRFLVQVDYKNIGGIMSAVNSSPINFLFRSAKVTKPVLKEIVIEKKPPVQKQYRLLSGKDFWGTFPKVLPVPVDLGTCEAQKLNELPTQFDLLPEPPALVDFHYWVLDFKGE